MANTIEQLKEMLEATIHGNCVVKCTKCDDFVLEDDSIECQTCWQIFCPACSITYDSRDLSGICHTCERLPQ